MTSLLASKTLHFHTEGAGSTPGQETVSHTLQLRSGAFKQFFFKWLHLKHSAWHDLMRVCVSFPTCAPLDMRHAQSLSRVWLFVTSWSVAHQAPLAMKFFRQEYRSRLPVSAPRDQPNGGIKLASLVSCKSRQILHHYRQGSPVFSLPHSFLHQPEQNHVSRL